MKKNNRKLWRASTITFNVCLAVGGLAYLFSALTKQYPDIAGYVSSFLEDSGYTETITTGKEPVRFKTWYSSIEDVLNGNDDVGKAAESEGAVLLKNDNSALPLSTSDDKVSLFGVTAYQPIYSLDGAGEVQINADRQQYFYDEMEAAGLTMNKELADWYNSDDGRAYWHAIPKYSGGGNSQNMTLNGASWDTLPSSKTASGYNTAVFVVGRITNEGIDVMPSNNVGGARDRDFLKFTNNELSVLQGLKEAKDAGTFDKIVVLINSATGIMEDLPTLFDNYGVDAAMWVGLPGTSGIEAVADLLVGKSSPSGGLSDAWYTSRDAHPTTPYYGNGSNLLIQEDIYYGYRYAETRYEDRVLGTGSTDSYIYGDNISYPFGYGLSYSEFSYTFDSLEIDNDPLKNYYDNTYNEVGVEDEEKAGKRHEIMRIDDPNRRKEGDDYIANVTVTNTGDMAAKQTVEIYLSKPYTETDKQHGVEDASVELIGYGKTDKLEPGASQTLQIRIDANKYFASYDDSVKNYTVEPGTYYLVAATNSHEAVNSLLKAKAEDGVQVDQGKMDDEYGAGDANNVQSVNVTSEYSENYKYWTKGGNEVTNLFDFADPNKVGDESSHVSYMSRSNWTQTADQAKNQSVTVSGDMGFLGQTNGGSNFSVENAQKYYPEAVASFEDKYPTFRDEDAQATMTLAEMIGVEYDTKRGATEEDVQKWEDFLNQLSWSELATLTGTGRRMTAAIESIGKPQTNDVNASNAISWHFNMGVDSDEANDTVGFGVRFDPDNARKYYPTGYPCEGIIASTFNNELAYAIGQAIGEDGLWSGAAGLYGFGLGLHRNPYHGRTGEYYSEDPFLTGMIGGYSSLGAQSKGLYVYNKHFVLNDQEQNRTGYNTWLNEQSFREIYLRPFEIAIEIGDAMNVMNSFNHIGTAWSGNCYNLMTAWLRGEAGMAGFAVTDWYKSGGMNMTYGILAGTDLPDGTDDTTIENNGPAKGNTGFYAQAVRQSAKRILYVVANSNAMNFIGDDTRIVVHEPNWYAWRDNVQYVGFGLIGASALFMIAAGLYTFVFKRDETVNN